MKKFFIIIVFVSLCAGFGYSAVTAYKGEAVKLTLGCFPSLDVAYKAILPSFNKVYPNINVEVRALGYGDYHNMLITTLAAGKGAPDVSAIEIGYIAQLGAGGGFENLLSAPYNAGEYKKDFSSFKWAQGSLGPRVLFAMPIDIAPGCIWYRKDVFDARKVKIESIKTIEDLYTIGPKLTYASKGDGKVDHWLLSGANYIFNMIFFSSPQHYFNQEGKPDLTSDRIKEAFTWSKKFRDAGLDAKIGDWSNEWYAALKDGTIAYTPSGAWLGGHLKSWIAPEAKGKFRVAELPALHKGERPMKMSQGGSFLAIPTQIADVNKAAAWELIKWLTTRVDSQLISFDKADAFPAYRPAWKNKIFNEGIDYLGGQKARRMWIEIAEQIPEVYVNQKDALASSILNEALAEVLDGKKTVDKALTDGQKQLENTMNQ